jgi:hypothetical protein
MPEKKNGYTNHTVTPYSYDDDGKTVYACRKGDCWFESDNLSDVAQHVTENQFVVTSN